MDLNVSAGAAGRRPGVPDQTKRPPKEELHTQQWAALGAGKVNDWSRPSVRRLQLALGERSGGMTCSQHVWTTEPLDCIFWMEADPALAQSVIGAPHPGAGPSGAVRDRQNSLELYGASSSSSHVVLSVGLWCVPSWWPGHCWGGNSSLRSRSTLYIWKIYSSVCYFLLCNCVVRNY